MRLIFQFIILGFFLNACSSNIDVQKENFVFQKNVDAYNSERYRLLDYYWTIVEVSEDKSLGIDLLKKVNPMFLHVDSMRNELEVIIQEIESFKKDILKESGNNLSFQKNDFSDSLVLKVYDFNKFYGNGAANLELYKLNSKFQKIKSAIFKFRNNLIQHAVNSSSTKEIKFSFKDPNIKDFSNEKRVNLELEKSLKKVAPDDYETVKKVYIKTSSKNPFLDKDYEEFLNGKNVIDKINILTNIQTQIVSSTADLFALIRSRMGGGGTYQFDRIFVNVDGPEAVQKEDSIELRVFYSFYNSYGTPSVIVERSECKQYLKDGITYIKFKTNDKDEFLKGKLIISNRSGVIKTMNWEKKIKVISSN